MKKNFENNNSKEKELYKEKINKIEELCDFSMPICIYDSESKFKIIENIALRTNDNLNIIEDYCENDNKLNHCDSFNFKSSEIDCDEILVQRNNHICDDYRKNLSKSLTIQKRIENKKESNDSFISTGTEKSNEKENIILDNHSLKKKKYKDQRKNKYYSQKVESYKEDIKYNYKNFETQIIFDDYEKFVNHVNNKYKMVSMANIYILQALDNDKNLIINNNLEYTG